MLDMLKVTSMNEKMREFRLRWVGPDNYMGKRVQEIKIEGKREEVDPRRSNGMS